MPFAAAAPIIASVAGGGLGILGSVLGGKPKTSTSTTTPTFSPEMQQLQSQLLAYSQDSMVDPMKGLAPIRNAALDNINRSYMNVPTAVSSQLASRGYGSSGNVGNSLYRVALAKGGAQSDLEGSIATQAINQRNIGAGIGQQLLNSGRGTTTTSTGPNTSAADGFATGGNALSDLSRLLSFNNFLKAGKGSGGGGSSSGGYSNWDDLDS